MVRAASDPPHWAIKDRRRNPDRRTADRRRDRMPVPAERRARDRRGVLDRRETIGGHVRNAMQILSGIVDWPLEEPDTQDALRAAVDRLWRALRETERMAGRRG